MRGVARRGRAHARETAECARRRATRHRARWALELPQGFSIIGIVPGVTLTTIVPAFEPRLRVRVAVSLALINAIVCIFIEPSVVVVIRHGSVR